MKTGTFGLRTVQLAPRTGGFIVVPFLIVIYALLRNTAGMRNQANAAARSD